jgi:hypothetical protein
MTAEKPVDPENHDRNPAALDRNKGQQGAQRRFL